MAEVKWIKLATNIFDNRKIRQIECLPDGDAIIVIWLKLLILSGNINDSGYVYFTREIPYTDQMLSTQFGRPLTTVQLALKTFEQFGMVEVIDNLLHISNWEKYQSVDKLSELREYNRIAKQKSRQKQKLLPPVNDKSMTSQQCHYTDIDKEEDIDEEKENNNISDSESKKPKKPVKHKYGSQSNIMLTDDEHQKLVSKFGDQGAAHWIDVLSEGIALKGYKYKSHYLAVLKWAKNDSGKAASNGNTERTDGTKWKDDTYI